MSHPEKISSGKKTVAKVVEHLDRFSIVQYLSGNSNVGIELGVAAGGFSANMVASGKFSKFFGVDVYADHHNLEEYKRALTTVGIGSNYSLLKMEFEEALDLFPDEFFDFIYFDGYAHTGEMGGKPYFDWLPKLKDGGIFAGDDYHEKWPLVIQAVNHFVSETGAELNLTDPSSKGPDPVFDNFPSWFIFNDRLCKRPKRNKDLEDVGRSLYAKTAEAHQNKVRFGAAFVDIIEQASGTDEPIRFTVNEVSFLIKSEK